MWVPFKIWLSLLLICFSVTNVSSAKKTITSLLPDSVEGWSKYGTAEIYNRKNLFDYLDGGAEVYLAYDFQQLVVQRYHPLSRDSSGEKSITVEIWRMNSSTDAFGLFSLDREGEEVKIGQRGAYLRGLLRFYKDGFFVRILGMESELKPIILKLGEEIGKKIKYTGRVPRLVQRIPPDSLIRESVRFFHKQIILNNLYFLSDHNLLNLGEKTDCVLADFKLGGESLKLLLIQYPDTTRSRVAKEKFKKAYLKNGSFVKERIFKTKEKKLVGMDAKGDYLVLILGGKDERNILWLLNSVRGFLDSGGE